MTNRIVYIKKKQVVRRETLKFGAKIKKVGVNLGCFVNSALPYQMFPSPLSLINLFLQHLSPSSIFTFSIFTCLSFLVDTKFQKDKFELLKLRDNSRDSCSLLREKGKRQVQRGMWLEKKGKSQVGGWGVGMGRSLFQVIKVRELGIDGI